MSEGARETAAGVYYEQCCGCCFVRRRWRRRRHPSFSGTTKRRVPILDLKRAWFLLPSLLFSILMQKHMTHSCCKDLVDRIAGADLLNEIAQHVDRTVPCYCESDCFFCCCEISPCLMLIWMLPNAGAWRMLGKCSTRILPLQGRGCCWLDNNNSSRLCCH